MQPSSAEYWHIGAITTRLGRVMPPIWIGSNSLGGCNGDTSFGEGFPEGLREGHGAGLVAMQAHGIRGHRDALARQAGDVALLDHRERLLCRSGRVLDHAAGLVARRERAVVRVAAVREHFAESTDACFFSHIQGFTSG